MRNFKMLQASYCMPVLPGMTVPKTYAAWPVWRDSHADPVRFEPTPKKAAVRLYHRARDFERRTRQPGRQDGRIGRNGLAVLHALIFDCLNFATGQLDPAISTIARKAAISARSAARGLAALKAAGVVAWLRRCKGEVDEAGRFRLRQESNAYALRPLSQWLGYTPPPEPPRPQGGTWGDHPPLPDLVTAAAELRRTGASPASVVRELALDPADKLAAALASLGRTLQAKETEQFTGLPA